MSRPLFPQLRLDDELVRDLRRTNPWWEGEPMQRLPATRRHLVGQIQRRLDSRIAPIVVVRGPRQIGKTTAQLHLIEDLLRRGVPPRNIMRVQCDDLPALARLEEPVLRIVDWYEQVVLGKSLNAAAHADEPTILLFDEVQNLNDWATQLKSLADSSTTQVVVTGSSALRIELGRDSLAGRITTIEAGVLSLTEVASFRDIDLGKPFLHDSQLEAVTSREFWAALLAHAREKHAEADEAFRWFAERGGYPLVHKNTMASWSELADQLNETVIKRVIQHDLRIGERGRKRDAALLEEVFRLACRYVGQSPSIELFAREANRALNAGVGSHRIRNYLRFLGDTLLLRLIEPLEIRLKKKRGSPKICLADHGLRASWLQENVPLHPSELDKNPHLMPLAGHIAESVVGATLVTVPSLDVSHLPERAGEPEIDFVITVGTTRIPIEVKYQRRIDPLRDTEGLRTFLEKSVNNAPFGLLVTQDGANPVRDPRLLSIPLPALLLIR